MIIVNFRLKIPAGADTVGIYNVTLAQVVREAWAAYSRGERVIAAVSIRDRDQLLSGLMPPQTKWVDEMSILEPELEECIIDQDGDHWRRVKFG
jgi:hypothetical protein